MTIYVTAIACSPATARSRSTDRARDVCRLLEPLRHSAATTAPRSLIAHPRARRTCPRTASRDARELRARARPRRGSAADPRAACCERASLCAPRCSMPAARSRPSAKIPRRCGIAEQLDGMGAKLFEMFANQIRANYHGLRGEEELAESYRRQVELFAVQAGSGWQAELWSPASAILYYMLAEDLVGQRNVHRATRAARRRRAVAAAVHAAGGGRPSHRAGQHGRSASHRVARSPPPSNRAASSAGAAAQAAAAARPGHARAAPSKRGSTGCRRSRSTTPRIGSVSALITPLVVTARAGRSAARRNGHRARTHRPTTPPRSASAADRPRAGPCTKRGAGSRCWPAT